MREIGTLNQIVAGRSENESKRIHAENNRGKLKMKGKKYYEENKKFVKNERKSKNKKKL